MPKKLTKKCELCGKYSHIREVQYISIGLICRDCRTNRLEDIKRIRLERARKER